MARGKIDAARPGSDAVSRKVYRERLHSGAFNEKGKPPNHQAFLDVVIPVAKEVEARTGHDWRLIVGQAAQETGWGSKVEGNAFWGVKSHGYKGDTVAIDTHEMDTGKREDITDIFRAYKNIGEAADGYIRFLQDNPRYSEYLKAAKKKDLKEALRLLDESSYATDLVEEEDPHTYGEKVGGVITGRTLRNHRKNPERGRKYTNEETYQFDRYSSERYNALLSERKSSARGGSS